MVATDMRYIARELRSMQSAWKRTSRIREPELRIERRTAFFLRVKQLVDSGFPDHDVAYALGVGRNQVLAWLRDARHQAGREEG